MPLESDLVARSEVERTRLVCVNELACTGDFQRPIHPWTPWNDYRHSDIVLDGRAVIVEGKARRRWSDEARSHEHDASDSFVPITDAPSDHVVGPERPIQEVR